jgi:predicted nucleic acid-binding protein
MHTLVDFLADVVILDVTPDVARRYGEVQAGLLDAGQPAPEMDLLIGATALVHDLTVVTHYHHHFARIPGLRLDDWLVP